MLGGAAAKFLLVSGAFNLNRMRGTDASSIFLVAHKIHALIDGLGRACRARIPPDIVARKDVRNVFAFLLTHYVLM